MKRIKHAPRTDREETSGGRGGAKGAAVAAVTKKLGVTEQTYHRWKRQYGSMDVDCRSHRGDSNATDSSTTGTEHSPFTRHSIRNQGEVIGKTAARHTSEEFVAFLLSVVSSQPKGKEIHIILDNLSAHETARVKQFIVDYPNVVLHLTPTYSSWLNQVEIWLSKIERDVISRGVFTSIPDLRRKLITFITRYNEQPRPIRWSYTDVTKRVAGHQTIIYTPRDQQGPWQYLPLSTLLDSHQH